MKLRNIALIIVCVLLLSMVMIGVASAEEVHHTVTFHSGEDGLFENGENINVLTYSLPWVEKETITQYSHTSNITDAGVQNGNYSNYEWMNHVYSVPGAESLTVEITYSGESTSWDWACVWAGSHLGYDPEVDYGSSISGKLGGYPRQTSTYTIPGDSVTIGFCSDSSGCGDGYGYYAVITGTLYELTLTDGTYTEPVATDPEWVFKGWNTRADGTGTVMTERDWEIASSNLDLYAVYQNKILGRGVYRDVNWSLTYDGILTFGVEGETQHFRNASSQSTSDLPWYNNRESITSVQFLGTVYGTGSMEDMFYGCKNLAVFDASNFNTHDVTDISFMFYNAGSLKSLDMSSWDVSSLVKAERMFDGYSSGGGSGIENLNLSGLDLSNLRGNYDDGFEDFTDGMSNLKVLNIANTKFVSSSSAFSDMQSLEVLILDGPNPFAYESSYNGLSYSELPKTMRNPDTGLYYDLEWVREDGAYGPYLSADFVKAYNADMGGTWVRRLATTDEFGVKTSSTFYLVKSVTPEVFASGEYGTIHSISGGTYTGNIYRLNQSYLCSSSKSFSGATVKAVDEVHPTTMCGWFDGCISLRYVDLDKVDMAGVTDCRYMFEGCNSLESIDMSNWNVSNITNMTRMFYCCSSLTSVTFGDNFDISNVSDLSNMFAYCSDLESIDISGLDMTNVHFLNDFLRYNLSLTSIVLGENSVFKNSFGSSYLLPDSAVIDDETYAIAWVREDGAYGPYSPTELRDNYTSEMAGTWIVQKRGLSEYAIYVEEDQCLYFVVADTPAAYGSGSTQTINSISGDSYTGVVYPLLKYGTEYVPYYGSGYSSAYTVEKTPWRYDDFTKVIVVDPMKTPANISGWFKGCYQCTTMDLKNFDTSECVNMEALCSGCSGLTSIDMTGWDTSSVTDMSSMFYGCSSLEELDVSLFDVSSVTDFYAMFSGCSGLTHIDVENWNTESAVEMGSVFEYCSSLEELDLSHWNVENVTEMANMCSGCSGLKSLNVSNWHFKNYVHLRMGFSGCTSLEHMKIENWKLDDGGYIYSAFSSCYDLVTFDMSGCEFRTKVGGSHYLSSYYFLSSCSKLESFDLSNCTFYGYGDVVNLSGMCSSGCSSLKYVNMSGLHLAGKVAMTSTFYGCPLEEVDVSDWHDDGIESLSLEYTFQSTTLPSLDTSSSHIGGITNLYGTFYGCQSLEWADLSGWDVTYLTTAESMFSSCRNLERVDLTGWHPMYLTEIDSMFNHCEKIKSLDLSGWNTEAVSTMDYVFSYCSNLSELNLSGWTSDAVKSMSSMLYGCNRLEVLNIDSLDPSGVKDISSMGLSACSWLHEVTLGPNWSFFGDPSQNKSTMLTTPLSSLNGYCYGDKWIREDEVYGPYLAAELRDAYTRLMWKIGTLNRP